MAKKCGISYYTVKDLYEELGKIVDRKGDCPILLPSPYRDECDTEYILMGSIDDEDINGQYIYFDNVSLEDDMPYDDIKDIEKWSCPCCGSKMNYIGRDNTKLCFVCEDCDRHIEIGMGY